MANKKIKKESPAGMILKKAPINIPQGKYKGKQVLPNVFWIDIANETIKNKNFRKVIYTSNHLQLVLMTLQPGENIGTERHRVDQFIRVDQGEGMAIVDGTKFPLKDDQAIIIPSFAEHDIINTSKTKTLHLYTLYGPQNHLDGTVHKVKKDAKNDKNEL